MIHLNSTTRICELHILFVEPIGKFRVLICTIKSALNRPDLNLTSVSHCLELAMGSWGERAYCSPCGLFSVLEWVFPLINLPVPLGQIWIILRIHRKSQIFHNQLDHNGLDIKVSLRTYSITNATPLPSESRSPFAFVPPAIGIAL